MGGSGGVLEAGIAEKETAESAGPMFDRQGGIPLLSRGRGAYIRCALGFGWYRVSLERV